MIFLLPFSKGMDLYKMFLVLDVFQTLMEFYYLNIQNKQL
ncbi:hypothetical protein XBFM1_520073 [Xenorhabdus bovienii str. feltiae Moldova]|uniref:Uncharacterized protein n=1 Tax=Xenorhabdus bovienii str. feltiae Moldova TaxID=1398200 RepID=A0A077NZI2_XENBV|nr:hypothetical protein XBFM1_520073 [Xenorhabdus bovienii str. feltiae Moldova]